MKTLTRLCVLLSAPFAFCSPLCADVLFSQGVRPDGTYPGGGFVIGGTDYTSNGQYFGYHSVGSYFSLEVDALITRINLGLAYIEDFTPRDVLIKLEGDNPALGIPNGQMMASGIVTATHSLLIYSADPVPFVLSSPIVLTAGETFWIVAEPTEPSTANVWSSQSKIATYSVCHLANSPDGTNYTARYSYDWPAFQVIGTPIPEPSPLLLFLSATLLLTRGERHSARHPKR